MSAPAEDPRGGDDLDRYIAEQQRDPEFRAAFAAAQARPAGDRAQPTQELREAIAQQRAEQFGTLWNDLTERIGTKDVFRAEADQILALPAIAALLDAQAAVNRVRAALRASLTESGLVAPVHIATGKVYDALDGT